LPRNEAPRKSLYPPGGGAKAEAESSAGEEVESRRDGMKDESDGSDNADRYRGESDGRGIVEGGPRWK